MGDNSGGETNVPARLTDVVAIAAGQSDSMALKADGTVVTWGYNRSGDTDVPLGLANVLAISAGYDHTVALKADGTVVVWGSMDALSGLKGVVAVSAGSFFSVALKADGTVAAWGSDNDGDTQVPSGLGAVSAVSANSLHSLALAGITVSPDSLAPGTAGVSHPDVTFTEAGGSGTITWSRTGSLPSGMSFTDNGDGTATLSGTPTQAGTFGFTVKAADALGGVGTRNYALTVFSVSYRDDSGRSVLCVDTTTGAYRWAVLSGIHAGKVYTGTLHVYNRGTLFWSQGGPGPTIIINYFPSSHVVWGFLYDSSTPVYSRLYDSNTLDDPSGCGALPPVLPVG